MRAIPSLPDLRQQIKDRSDIEINLVGARWTISVQVDDYWMHYQQGITVTEYQAMRRALNGNYCDEEPAYFG